MGVDAPPPACCIVARRVVPSGGEATRQYHKGRSNGNNWFRVRQGSGAADGDQPPAHPRADQHRQTTGDQAVWVGLLAGQRVRCSDSHPTAQKEIKLRTAEVQKVLETQGWKVIRESGSHKILQKGQVKMPFAYHDREIGAVQIRQLARRYGVDINEFFRPASQLRPTAVQSKPIEVITPKAITEGPITGDARLVFLRVDSLQIDHAYQRPLNAQWARWLAQNWDDRMLGVMTASERSDGSVWLLEGQHRSAALVAVGLGERRVPVIVFKNLSLKEEADIYLGRNTAKQQTSLALYTAKL